MKYVITNKGEVKVGSEHTLHVHLTKNLRGEVIAAGHYDMNMQGIVTRVYGESIGYGIKAKEQDKETLQKSFDVSYCKHETCSMSEHHGFTLFKSEDKDSDGKTIYYAKARTCEITEIECDMCGSDVTEDIQSNFSISFD